jgi:hypothetical protein
MSYNTKNYTEQGGEKTVIGGTLEIKEEASVKGLPSAANQTASTAADAATLKNDFNALLLKLKDAGLMTPNEWNVSVSDLPTPPETPAECALNQAAVVSFAIADGIIAVTVDPVDLAEYASSNPAQGTHKWIGMLISTGLSDITAVKYNGFQLTSDDVTEAASVGGSAGDIVMWLKCDEIVSTPKVFTLLATGYPKATFTVVIAVTESQE